MSFITLERSNGESNIDPEEEKEGNLQTESNQPNPDVVSFQVCEYGNSLVSQESPPRKATKIEIPSCFEKIGFTGRRKIRCTVYYNQPNVIKISNGPNKKPPICSEDGSEIRKKYTDNHVKSTMHREAVKGET